jgi:hypothetical protein
VHTHTGIQFALHAGWLSFLSLFMYNHTLQWMDHPWQDYARVYASYANTPQVLPLSRSRSRSQ